MKIFVATVVALLFCAGVGAEETYTVNGGDNLWKISAKKYGDGRKWRRIYNANRRKIRNANHIRPGTELVIPRGKPKARSRVPKGYEIWKRVPAKLTAYEPSYRCCGKFADGLTSTGRSAWRMDGCATDPRAIPYGIMIDIPGVGIRRVDDTGSAMRKAWKRGRYHVDVRYRYYSTARRFGTKTRTVTLYRKKRPGNVLVAAAGG